MTASSHVLVTSREEHYRKMAQINADYLKQQKQLQDQANEQMANDDKAAAEKRQQDIDYARHKQEEEQVFIELRQAEIVEAKKEEARLAELDYQIQKEIQAYVVGVQEKTPDELQAEKAKIEEQMRELEKQLEDLQKQVKELQKQRDDIKEKLNVNAEELKMLDQQDEADKLQLIEIQQKRAERIKDLDMALDKFADNFIQALEKKYEIPFAQWTPDTQHQAIVDLGKAILEQEKAKKMVISIDVSDSSEEAVLAVAKAKAEKIATRQLEQAKQEPELSPAQVEAMAQKARDVDKLIKSAQQIEVVKANLEKISPESKAAIDAYSEAKDKADSANRLAVEAETTAASLVEKVQAAKDALAKEPGNVELENAVKQAEAAATTATEEARAKRDLANQGDALVKEKQAEVDKVTAKLKSAEAEVDQANKAKEVVVGGVAEAKHESTAQVQETFSAIIEGDKADKAQEAQLTSEGEKRKEKRENLMEEKAKLSKEDKATLDTLMSVCKHFQQVGRSLHESEATKLKELNQKLLEKAAAEKPHLRQFLPPGAGGR